MPRLILLTIGLVAALALPAGAGAAAKTWTVSDWVGTLRIETEVDDYNEDIEYADGGGTNERSLMTATGRHVMKGRIHATIPRKGGRQPFFMGGGGTLIETPGTWETFSLHEGHPGGPTQVTCRGTMRKSSNPRDNAIQALLDVNRRRGLVISAPAYLGDRDPRCSAEVDDPAGPHVDGWPDDEIAFAMPGDVHEDKAIRGSLVHWTWSTTCGDHPDRSGFDGVPPKTHEVWSTGECTGRHYVLRRVVLTLKRTCRTRVVRRVGRGGAKGRCVRKQ